MTNDQQRHDHGRFQINTNTGLSISVIVVAFGGFWAVLNGINTMKSKIDLSELSTGARIDKFEAAMVGKMEKMEARMTILEANKNTVTATEFFKWAIHLQQLNRDPKALQSQGLKVPEPEMAK